MPSDFAETSGTEEHEPVLPEQLHQQHQQHETIETKDGNVTMNSSDKTSKHNFEFCEGFPTEKCPEEAWLPAEFEAHLHDMHGSFHAVHPGWLPEEQIAWELHDKQLNKHLRAHAQPLDSLQDPFAQDTRMPNDGRYFCVSSCHKLVTV